MGVEPTGDRIACHPPVLKTGTITGPHALPWPCEQKATDRQTAVDQSDFYSDPRESVRSVADSLTYALRHPLLGLRGDSQVRLNGLKAGKLLLRFLV